MDIYSLEALNVLLEQLRPKDEEVNQLLQEKIDEAWAWINEKTAKEITMPGDCARCGEFTQDLRTLHMSCFYDMSEINIGLEPIAVRGKYCLKAGTKDTRVGPANVYAEKEGAETHDYPFWIMRVCKECRGKWLGVIQDWYRQKEQKESEDEEVSDGDTQPTTAAD